MDFPSVQKKAYNMLQRYPEVLLSIQDQIKYLMVDEYQDMETYYTLLVEIQFLSSYIPVRLLVEVKLFKENGSIRASEHPDLRLYRHGGQFLRLAGKILAFAVAVTLAPRHFVGHNNLREVCGVDVQRITLPHHPDNGTGVGIGHAEAAAFAIDKPVKGDLPRRTEVEPQFGTVLKNTELRCTGAGVYIVGYAECGLVKKLFCFSHQYSAWRLRSITLKKVLPARKFSFTNLTRRSTLPLEGMAGLAQLRLETHRAHLSLHSFPRAVVDASIAPLKDTLAFFIRLLIGDFYLTRYGDYRPTLTPTPIQSTATAILSKIMLFKLIEEYARWFLGANYTGLCEE